MGRGKFMKEAVALITLNGARKSCGTTDNYAIMRSILRSFHLSLMSGV